MGEVLLLWSLLRVKRMDVFNNASVGINIGFGAKFDGIPRFLHGLYGIIISLMLNSEGMCGYFNKLQSAMMVETPKMFLP